METKLLIFFWKSIQNLKIKLETGQGVSQYFPKAFRIEVARPHQNEFISHENCFGLTGSDYFAEHFFVVVNSSAAARFHARRLL